MAILSSGYVSSAPISISNTGAWIFTAPKSPSLRVAGITVRQPLSSNITETTGTFKPLGGSNTIVVSASMYGIDGDYEFVVQGEAAWTNLLTLLRYQGTIYVQDPLGRAKYVRFVTRNIIESGRISALIRTVKVSYLEVSAT